MIDLRVYLIEHLLGEDNSLVPAFEEVFSDQIGVLVEDDLIHIEFVEVGVKKTLDNGFEFHFMILLSVFTVFNILYYIV